MYLFLVILLLLFGISLIVAEIFLIPGVGFAGLFGLVSLAASVYLAYAYISPLAGHIALCASLLCFVVAIYAFLRGKTLDKMALKTDIDGKVDLASKVDAHVGDVVTTASRLAPMGKVQIGTAELEAKSEGGFVDPNTPVCIVKIEGNIVIVKPI